MDLYVADDSGVYNFNLVDCFHNIFMFDDGFETGDVSVWSSVVGETK